MLRKIIFTIGLSMVFCAAPSAKMTWEDLNQRFAEAIRSTLDDTVVLDDILGEGPGHWDADPRYPEKKVNCIIWLQLIISEIYGKGLADKNPVMDRIRYFGGYPGYALRKHYTDHWVSIEPRPLVPVSLSGCTSMARFHVDLKPEKFLRHVNFSCPLYHQERTAFDIEYVRRDGLMKCTGSLAPGYYILFAVPSESYSRKYLRETGPMGLVHAMILHLPERSPRGAMIYHASTAAKRVLQEPLSAFLEKSKTIHMGYVVYELDPDWSYKDRASATPEMLQLLECESKIK